MTRKDVGVRSLRAKSSVLSLPPASGARSASTRIAAAPDSEGTVAACSHRAGEVIGCAT